MSVDIGLDDAAVAAQRPPVDPGAKLERFKTVSRELARKWVSCRLLAARTHTDTTQVEAESKERFLRSSVSYGSRSSVAVGLLRISDAMQGAEPLGPYSHVARAERRCYVGNQLASERLRETWGERQTDRPDTRSMYVG